MSKSNSIGFVFSLMKTMAIQLFVDSFGLQTVYSLLRLGIVDIGLSGSFPSSLLYLSSLISLDVFGNNLKGTLPSEIAELTLLESLNVNGNQLTGEIPSSIFQMTRLDTINLGGSGVGGNDLTGSFDCRMEGSNVLPAIGVDCAAVTPCECCTCCKVDRDCLLEDEEDEAIEIR